jgi:hypothetical protein
MKLHTSPPLTYFPAYVGLWASLSLAWACNCFLDIQYGTFTFEVIAWTVMFALTAQLGWRQLGEVKESGTQAQKAIAILGLVLTVIVFIPMWGFPRAGLAMLSVLQAAQNCVTVTRRQLHAGLLVSAVMVMFAASHYRADWTMLFYLVPYLVAVVFALVSEQISRRAGDMRRESLGAGTTSGQGAAIAAATATILTGGALLYAITPQVTSPSLFWKFGQPGSIGKGIATSQTGQGMSPGSNPGMGDDELAQGKGAATARPGGWPTLKDMREAARRPGMPKWQSSTIEYLADLVATTDVILMPIRLGLDDLWEDIKTWLQRHSQTIAEALLAMIGLALLLAAWLLLKEARLGVWVLAQSDYLRLGLLRQHGAGKAGALQYYLALQRLLDVQGLARAPFANAREFLAQVSRRYEHLRRPATEITLLFERARYGSEEITAADLNRMNENYRRIFRDLDRAPQAASADG